MPARELGCELELGCGCKVRDLNRAGLAIGRHDGGAGRQIEIHDLQVALVEHEGEHPLDVLTPPGGAQRRGPADIADARRQLGERRQRIGLRRELERAEHAQLLQQEKRVLAQQKFRARPKADRVAALRALARLVEVNSHRHEWNVEVLGRRVGAATFLVMPDQGLERGPTFVAVAGRHFLARARHGDQVRQHVACREQHVENIGSGRQGAVPHRIEHRLEHVREPDQRLEAEDPGAALGRMDGAKYGVHRVVGFAAVTDIREAGIDRFETLFGFL